MKNFMICLTFLLLFMAGWSGDMLARSTCTINSIAPPEKVLQAAEKGLREWADLLGTVSDDEKDIQVTDARLGFCFQVFTAHPNDLLYQTDLHIRDIAYALPIWRFAVFSGDNPICLMTVERMDGVWEATEIGSADLAQEMNLAVRELSRDGSSFRFVRVYQATSDFIELTSRDSKEIKYALLKSARISLGQENADQKKHTLGPIRPSIRTNKDIVGLLQDTVRRHIQEEEEIERNEVEEGSK